jgi:hypothetical protein
MAGHQILVIYVKKLMNSLKKNSDKYELKCTIGKGQLHRYIHILLVI